MDGNKCRLFADYGRSWLWSLAGGILKQGPIPKHVGFIMDGNRRYAKEQRLATVTEGHKRGNEKISEVLSLLGDLGIAEVTLYAFSLENFRRSPAEVEGLMEIFTERFEEMWEDVAELKRRGVQVEVVGDYTRASTPRLRQLYAGVMSATRRENDAPPKLKLNWAFAYTAQEEMARGMNHLLGGLSKEELQLGDLSESLLEETLALTPNSNPGDLIIRPGGECRLSDFLLWQGSSAYLEFAEGAPWPEYTPWHFLGAVLRYQRHVLSVGGSPKRGGGEGRQKGGSGVRERQQLFLEKVRDRQWAKISQDARQAVKK